MKSMSPNSLNVNNKINTNPVDIANCFNDYFSNIGSRACRISVGHRTMSDRNNGLSDSNRFLSDIVSERKKYKHIMYNYIVKKY